MPTRKPDLPVQEYHFSVHATQFQFYLQDEDVPRFHPEQWPEQANTARLKVVPGLLAVRAARAMRVPVSLKIFAREAPMVEGRNGLYTHVIEADLQVDSGKIRLLSQRDKWADVFPIRVDRGRYRVRVYFANLHTLRKNGQEGDDFYDLHLWPVSLERPMELKR
ncbi:MAG: hypothetical protein AAFR61_20975 [Bacteroidota bacterium]